MKILQYHKAERDGLMKYLLYLDERNFYIHKNGKH